MTVQCGKWVIGACPPPHRTDYGRVPWHWRLRYNDAFRVVQMPPITGALQQPLLLHELVSPGKIPRDSTRPKLLLPLAAYGFRYSCQSLDAIDTRIDFDVLLRMHFEDAPFS